MSAGTIILCRFSAGLDDLSSKQQGNHEAVIEVLRRTKKFSVFEAAENAVIASTMTQLCAKRLTTDHDKLGYPWTVITAIDGKPI